MVEGLGKLWGTGRGWLLLLIVGGSRADTAEEDGKSCPWT